MTANRKRIQTAIAALLVGVLLLCALFIVAEAHHHCTGDECAVCACIRLCERVLHPLLSPGAVSAFRGTPALLFALAAALLWSVPAAKASPVSEKVRIND